MKRGPGYIDYVGDEEHYWRNQTLWDAANKLVPQSMLLDELPRRDDGCHILGSPPKWGKVADQCRQVMSVDTSYPVIIGPSGDIVDGIHRIIRAYVEGLASIPCVTLSEMPPPDDVWPYPEGEQPTA